MLPAQDCQQNGEQGNGLTPCTSKRKKKAKKRKASRLSEDAEETVGSTSVGDDARHRSDKEDAHGGKIQKKAADNETDVSGAVQKRDASLFGSGDGNASEATMMRKVMGIVPKEGGTANDEKLTVASKNSPLPDFCFGFSLGEEKNPSQDVACSDHVEQEKQKPSAGSNHVDDSGINRRVYVGGLPFSLSEEDVKEFWSECGEVRAIQCLKFPDTKKFRGIAYLTFATEEGYQKALACNGDYVDGFELKVKPWESYAERSNGSKTDENSLNPEVLGEKFKGYNVAFVCNLPYDMTADNVKEVFEDIGVDYVRLHTREGTSESRGFAHVHFSSEDLLDKAVAKDGMVVQDRVIRIGYAKPREEEKEKPAKGIPSELKVDLTNKCSSTELGDVGMKHPFIHGIHVSNLPFTAQEEDIQHLFADYPIQKILLPTRRENHGNIGMCVVEFEDAASCESALQINGAQLGGRHVKFRYAKRRDLSKFRILVAKFAGHNGQKRGKSQHSVKKAHTSVEKEVQDNDSIEMEDDPLMALL